MKCLFCDKESDKEVCSDECEIIMNDTHERVIVQQQNFGLKVDYPTCKECGNRRKKYAQYCTKCSKERHRQRNREHSRKNRKPRICKNENCSNPLPITAVNSKKYCSDDCIPNYTKRYTDKKKAKQLERDGMRLVDKRYEGTVNPKWIQPRGSKRRKAMGLDDIKYQSKQSATHGFVY